MREGADLGALATDLRNLSSDLKFIESPPSQDEVLSKFLLSVSDFHLLLQDTQSVQKDFPSPDDPDAVGDGDDSTSSEGAISEPTAAQPAEPSPDISSIEPPASNGSDGVAYGGPDDPDGFFC
jgi:hypothetical protein